MLILAAAAERRALPAHPHLRRYAVRRQADSSLPLCVAIPPAGLPLCKRVSGSSVSSSLRVLAILALLEHGPFQQSTLWTMPITGMLAPAGVALLASAIVHIIALWALPIVCVTVDPQANLTAGIAVVATTWAVVAPRPPLLNKRAASATCGHCAVDDMPAVQVGTLNAGPRRLVYAAQRCWTARRKCPTIWLGLSKMATTMPWLASRTSSASRTCREKRRMMSIFGPKKSEPRQILLL